MPDPAGGAGRTFKSRMCTFVSSDRLEHKTIQTKNHDDFLISMQGGPFRETSHFSSDTGPSSAEESHFFSAVASWNLLLLDLEEEKVAKKGHKSEKKTMQG